MRRTASFSTRAGGPGLGERLQDRVAQAALRPVVLHGDDPPVSSAARRSVSVSMGLTV